MDYNVETSFVPERLWLEGRTRLTMKIRAFALSAVTLRLADPLMRGTLVRAVQRALKRAGFSPGRIDGFYGLQTIAAVNAFQLSNGLVSDGEVGPQTARALGIALP